MNLHDFNTKETRLAIKILAQLIIFEIKLNSVMWDKATFRSNKGIFEMTAKRLGTKHMIYVSLLLIRDKNDLPTASSAATPQQLAQRDPPTDPYRKRPN